MALLSFKTGEVVAWEAALEDYVCLHSASTAKKDNMIRKEFERWLGKPLREATEADALAYTRYSLDKPGAPHTVASNGKCSRWSVANKIGRLSCMCDFLAGNGYIPHNPWLAAKRLLGKAQSGDRRPTGRLSDADIAHLLNTPPATTKEGRRDRVLLALLFGAALRISEALKIALQDVSDGAKGALILRLRETKAGHDQKQVLQPWVADRVRELMAQRRREGATSAEPLLTSYYASGEPYRVAASYHGARKWFKRLLREAGLPEIATPHWGRASAITSLYEKGVEIRQLQKFARHSSTITTERYIKTLVSDDIDELPQRLLEFEKKDKA